MTAQGGKDGTDAVLEPKGAVLFDAVLTPQRSLGRNGYLALMAVFAGLGLVTSFLFWRIGAWPVVGFMGLDVALVWVAFRASYRHGRLYERVWLTRDEFAVVRVWPSGRQEAWRFDPFFTRIDFSGANEPRLRLSCRGSAVTLGGFLLPEERRSLADALRSALSGR